MSNTAAIELFRRFGSEVLYTSWILELPADATIVGGELPAGHRLRHLGPVDQIAVRREARDRGLGRPLLVGLHGGPGAWATTSRLNTDS